MIEGNSRIIDIVDVPIGITKKPGLIKQLSEGKDLAKNLKQENVTLEIQLKGETVLKLGVSKQIQSLQRLLHLAVILK